MLARIERKDTATVAAALIKQARKLPVDFYKSLTCDRGTEMKAHQTFTLRQNVTGWQNDSTSDPERH
jgi:IS30 family transposase